ncbi:amino acid adenylation domain-containing protein [Streptomyces sp. NPDC093510]|uniref:non-ribosomal peptide synthetase n=1 Tax=Streptomyces sp. NPDC093510 TaxID=3155199 RepID=UPI00341886D2
MTNVAAEERQGPQPRQQPQQPQPQPRTQPRPQVLAGDLLPGRFEEQARLTPDVVAVLAGGGAGAGAADATRVTYAELNARANRLAHHLIGAGIGPHDLVAVAMRRSAELVVAFLAVLKAGAAYVPFDVELHSQRLQFMKRDARPALLLTTAADADSVIDDADSVIDDADSGVDEEDDTVPVLVVDAPGTARELADASGANPSDADREAPLRPDHAAYVIYTSGSTGTPKGVVVTHHALAAYLAYARTAYPSVSGTALLHSSVAFDMTVTTLYAPLTTGGTLVINPLDDPGVRPTFLKVTPSHLALLATLPPEAAPSRELVVGGELLLPEVVEAFRENHPHVTVVNEYGPTEAAVGCCVHIVRPGDTLPPGAVPIGRPTTATTLYVLDEKLTPVAPGETGELYIAGDQLARGYLHRPDLTADRFVTDPYGPPGTRMYRTGDRVRQNAEGDLEYLGRFDAQVKIRGYRIELGEIESVLLRHEDVARVAVTVFREGTHGAHLVAYVVPRSPRPGTGAPPYDGSGLRAYAAGHLPDYMVPSAFVTLDELPLNANGKLETRELPAPRFAALTAFRAPATEVQTLLCGLFAEFSGAERVGLDDDFFALGGTSLGAAQIASKARRGGVRFSLRDVLDHRTVRRLAEAVH